MFLYVVAYIQIFVWKMEAAWHFVAVNPVVFEDDACCVLNSVKGPEAAWHFVAVYNVVFEDDACVC